jgi:alanine racemase
MSVRGRRFTIAGTVNMNQTILDLGDLAAEAGDEVILFGPGTGGEPTAQEWADALGTLSYEIVTRFTGQVPRRYRGGTLAQGQAADQTAADQAGGRSNGQVAAAH